MANSKRNDNAARRRLARQIAEVLANPACPAALHNAITDELKFYVELADQTRPRIIEMSLIAYDENRAEIEAEDEETGDSEATALIG